MTEPTSGNEAQRIYAGKYQSVEALEKGYVEQARETSKILARTKAQEERVKLLEATLAQLQTANHTDPAEALENEGVDPAQIEALVAQTVQKVLTPLISNAEAVATFGSEHAVINEFLRDNPDIQETFQSMVSANPRGAAEYVKLTYAASRAQAGEANAQRSDAEVKQKREDARAKAELPANRSESRATPDPQTEHDSRLEAAAARAKETGDLSALVKERLLGGDGGIEIWLPGEAPPPSMLKRQTPNG